MPPLSDTYAYRLPSRLNDGSSSLREVTSRFFADEPSSGMSIRLKSIASDANAIRRPSAVTLGRFSLPTVDVTGVLVLFPMSAIDKCIPVVAGSHSDATMRRESGSQSNETAAGVAAVSDGRT